MPKIVCCHYHIDDFSCKQQRGNVKSLFESESQKPVNLWHLTAKQNTVYISVRWFKSIIYGTAHSYFSLKNPNIWHMLTLHSRNEIQIGILKQSISLLLQNTWVTNCRFPDFKKMSSKICNRGFHGTRSTFPSRKARIRVAFWNSAYLLTLDLIRSSINRPRENSSCTGRKKRQQWVKRNCSHQKAAVMPALLICKVFSTTIYKHVQWSKSWVKDL